jgi:DNA-binding winged helix-turn-helix (wHTH) protein
MLYHFGNFTLDEERYELRRESEVLALEPRGCRCCATCSSSATAW